VDAVEMCQGAWGGRSGLVLFLLHDNPQMLVHRAAG
jgi:hypothetical protein